METTSEAVKILEKGPEYLRKQMELESEAKGRMSAVERLAASKVRYVKSQKVANTTQEPVISLGSASVSSTGSSNRSSKKGENHVNQVTEAADGVTSGEQVRRFSGKKRPDSLLLYRQKCELLKGAASNRRHHLARRLLSNPVNKKDPPLKVEYEEGGETLPSPEGSAKECGFAPQSERRRTRAAEEHREESSESGAKVTPGLLTVPEVERRPGKGVGRSHSDISSRYSKNFADFDSFFKYCGLDGEIIESLGRENFSARSDEIAINIRSISVSTSDGGFSRSSGDSDGLLEEELHDKIRQGTSVIERNARIIKWLYSCKNAIESGKTLRDLD